MENKGIYEQMKEKMENSKTVVKYDPQKSDWKQILLDVVKSMRNQPVRKPKIYLPLTDFGMLDDKQFVEFIEGINNSKRTDYILQGGSAGYDAFHARCKRLNIKLD